MDEQDKNSTFTYYKVGRSARIFPIDYSDNEFAALAGCDVRTARKVLGIDCLKPILLKQLCTSEVKSEHAEDGDEVIPIPAETARFLSAFYQITQKSTEYRRIINRPENVSESTKRQFTTELCQALCQQITSSSDTSNRVVNDFYRRTLFYNNTFNRAVLEDIWETQLLPKYQTLRKLAQQVPFEMQAQVLLDCLQQMDNAIFYLSSQPKNSPKEAQKAEQELQGILEQLLSGRVRKRSGGNSQAVYQVYNSQVDERTSMERAFRALNAPGSNQVLMTASRDAYLWHLTEKLSPSPMEDAYKTLHDYLAFTGYELTEEELNSYITDQCRRHCQQIIDSVTFFPLEKNADAPLTEKRNYLTDLIDWTIQNRISGIFQNFEADFQETLHLVRYLNAAQRFFRQHVCQEPLLWSILDGIPLQKDGVANASATSRKYFLMFSQYLQNACSVLYPDTPDIRDSDSEIINFQDWLSERLFQDGLAAVMFFDKEDRFNGFSSSYKPENILHAIKVCNTYISDKQARPPIEQVLQMLPDIMTVLLCQLLKHILDDSVSECRDYFLAFYSWLQKVSHP